MPACMPTEKETTTLAVATWLSAKASTTCWVPAPPGVSGTSVEAPQRTITSAARGSVAWTPKAASRK